MNTCPARLEWLSSLNVAFPVTYAYRDIAVTRSPIQRQSVTKLEEPLFPPFQTVDLSEDPNTQLKHCLAPLTLEVPDYAEDTNASHIMFGISTTILRLEESVPSLVRWLPDTQARLFVIVIESEQKEEAEAVSADTARKQALQVKLRSLGIRATLVDPVDLQESFSQKYFSLIKVMHENRNDETQWIATIDDDTFFPSIPLLVAMLAKYNHDENYYVGALSENWGAVVHYGLMAFGGAGVFLSRQMAQTIYKNYQSCQENIHASAGDLRLLECVNQISNTKLTNEPDLHQIDIWADLSGIFENGQMPLSLHHWKPGAANKDGYNIPMQHTIADVCKDCYLQRWQFGTDMMLTNGFSIAFYPHGDLETAKLAFTEETWAELTQVEDSFRGGTDHSLGPTREKLPLDDRKIQYLLIHSAVVDGSVKQAYWHAGVNGELDSILELSWKDSSRS